MRFLRLLPLLGVLAALLVPSVASAAEIGLNINGGAGSARAENFEQLSDTGAIEALADQVIAANPKPAADFRAGNAASLNFLKGQVMKLSKGTANPQLAGEILERKLK